MPLGRARLRRVRSCARIDIAHRVLLLLSRLLAQVQQVAEALVLCHQLPDERDALRLQQRLVTNHVGDRLLEVRKNPACPGRYNRRNLVRAALSNCKRLHASVSPGLADDCLVGDRSGSPILVDHYTPRLLFHDVDAEGLLVELPLLITAAYVVAPDEHEVVLIPMLAAVVKKVLGLDVVAVVIDEIDPRLAAVHECHPCVALGLFVLEVLEADVVNLLAVFYCLGLLVADQRPQQVALLLVIEADSTELKYLDVDVDDSHPLPKGFGVP